MANLKKPAFQDWEHLRLVVSNYRLIIDDAPPSYVGRGLLGLPGEGSWVVNRNSQLKERLPATNYSPFAEEQDELLKVLPGIDDIGVDRSSRIDQLLRRLTELRAYVWLSKQDSFKAALGTMKQRGKLTSTYAADDARLRLIKALVRPLQMVLLMQEKKLAPRFPSKEDVEEASRHAKRLEWFFTNRPAVIATFDISPFFIRCSPPPLGNSRCRQTTTESLGQTRMLGREDSETS